MASLMRVLVQELLTNGMHGMCVDMWIGVCDKMHCHVCKHVGRHVY